MNGSLLLSSTLNSRPNYPPKCEATNCGNSGLSRKNLLAGIAALDYYLIRPGLARPSQIRLNLSLRQSGSLLCKLRLERLFPVGHIHLVTLRIDEGCYSVLLQPLVFPFEVEVGAVRAQKDVAGQGFQDPEHPFIVGRNPWILGVVHELIA